MIDPKQRKELDQCNQCYMLGILATDETFFPNSGEEQTYITIMRNGSTLIFYVKALSTEPLPIINYVDNPNYSPLYIGMDSDRNQAIFPATYKYTTDEDQKKQLIEEKLRDKLILFKPRITIKNALSGEIPYRNMDIISVESDINVTGDEIYIPIPKTNIKNIEFEKKLKDGSDIILEDYPHVMDEPAYVVCGDYIYSNLINWTKNSRDIRTWSYKGPVDEIRKLKLNMDATEAAYKIIWGTDNIIFIERDFISESIDRKKDTAISILSTTGVDVQEGSLQKVTDEIAVQHNNVAFDNSEFRFLNSLKEYTVSQGLSYDMEDLINFHICVKTNPLTIVAGMSGTGKTQLARSYAKMLDSSEASDTLLFLPISPSFTEPGDLLGYLNNTNGLFIPSETGLTDFLLHAMDNPDSMHMVIFDEMNLSQVEHWFAPFISLLELKPDQRKLSMYSEKAHCINSERYKPTIELGPNIIFVGTVNIDETTKDFSDRVMDRANFIVLKKGSFVQLKEEQKDAKYREKTFEENYCHSFSKYSNWIDNDDLLSVYDPYELRFFDELHDLIYRVDKQKGVSFRIIERMGKYLKNIPIDEEGEYMLDRRRAFDIQIKQRLLTKIRGTENQYEILIGTTKNIDTAPVNSALYNFFDNDTARKISDFVLTKAEINKKAREISIYGYAN